MERPRFSPVLVIAFATVGLIVLTALLILVLSPAPQAAPEPTEQKAAVEYEKLKAVVAPLEKDGRLAEVMKHYDRFLKSKELMGTRIAKTVAEERRVLITKIDNLYRRDRLNAVELTQRKRYPEALALCDRMTLYAIGRMQQEVLDLRSQIQAYYDDRARDFYHKVGVPTFRKRMIQRNYGGALNWMLNLVGAGQLPTGIKREWLRTTGLDYEKLVLQLKKRELDAAIARIEPRLVLIERVWQMDTARMILFDLLCASYGIELARLVAQGLEHYLADGHDIRILGFTGKPEMSKETWQLRGTDGTAFPLDFSQIPIDELAYLAARGEHADIEKFREAAAADPMFSLRLGAAAMYSESPTGVAIALAHFKSAAQVHPSKIAGLFVRILESKLGRRD